MDNTGTTGNDHLRELKVDAPSGVIRHSDETNVQKSTVLPFEGVHAIAREGLRMTSANVRREKLRQLLTSGLAGTQDDLREHLQRLGFDTTQSTVSRDLKILGARRRLGRGGEYVYELRAPVEHVFPSEMILSVANNENQIVVRTRVGRAPAVGIELDRLQHPDLLGTIAGDDTVLVIPASIHKTAALAQRLRELAGQSVPKEKEQD